MNRYLYFTVFASGLTTLAIELAASRLLGPAFGTSNLVWASIIGLILIYLSVGYFVGGRWADRSPCYRTMYTVLAWGAFTSGLVPLAARPVLRFAADAFDQLQVGVLFGSFTAVLILFSVPVTLLGTISPFAIRLAITDSRRAGQISGRIYALSTLGSFIGTFLPVLVLIPLLGTTITFLIFSVSLTLVALAGLWHFAGRRAALGLAWMPAALILLSLLALRGGIKATQGQIYEGESAYNYIQVIQAGEYRLLRLNEGQGVHSIWHPTSLDYGGPWQQFLAAPFFNRAPYSAAAVERIAIVGLAGGTIARQASAVFGPVPIDGYEIDPQIIVVGQAYFGMTMPNLNAIAEDGRVGLAHSPARYTLIGVDAYRPPYIPWHLTTRQFFQLCRARLKEDGVLVINVGRSPTDRSLVDGLSSTIESVFPSVYVMDVPESFNTIIYATVQPTTILDFYANYKALVQSGSAHPLLVTAMERVILNQQPTPPPGQVYTDDWAPIEWVTNAMVLNFVFSGEVERLR